MTSGYAPRWRTCKITAALISCKQGPRREFLHVDDMAAACVHVMELPAETYEAHATPMCSHINVGTGEDCTIRELAETEARVTGFEGVLRFDTSRSDGAPRKLLDVKRLRGLGWRPSLGLREGLTDVYQWYCREWNEER